MIEDISNRLMRDFSTCLQSRIAADEPAPSGEAVTTGAEAPEAVAGADPEPAPSAADAGVQPPDAPAPAPRPSAAHRRRRRRSRSAASRCSSGRS